MELRDVQYFAVVAEHGNVRRASEALDLSPGALSKSLHRLESAMNARLFDRTPKGVELTPVGSALLAKVRRLTLTFDDIAREAMDLGKGLAGHIRVGASPADSEILPEACSALLREAPNVTLNITVSDTDVILPLLQEGKLDLLFNVLPKSPVEGLHHEVLFDDQYVAYASATHPLARRKKLAMADLAQERWVASSGNHRPKQILLRCCEEHGLQAPRFVVETRSIRLRLRIVGSSRLLGFGPRWVVEKWAARHPLAVLPVRELTIPRPVGALYRKDAYLPSCARRLIELFGTTASRTLASRS
jgi:DNA-binding transcriptional LysR family regulator